MVKLDEAGRMVTKAGRAVYVEGAEAKAQLIVERAALERGDDRRRPERGVRWSELKALRVSPARAATALQEELEKDPLIVSAIVEPDSEGFLSRSVQSGEPWKVWALKATVIFRDTQSAAEAAVEVPVA